MKYHLRESSLNLSDEVALLFAESIVDTVIEPLLVLGSDLKVIYANNSFYKYFRVIPSDTVDRFIYDLGDQQWNIPALRDLLENILPKSSVIKDFEVTHSFEEIGEKTLIINARRMDIEQHESMILISMEDITENKLAENLFHEQANLDLRRLIALVMDYNDAIILFDLDGEIQA